MPDERNNGDVAAIPPETAPRQMNSAEALIAVYGGPESAAFCSFDPRTPEGLRLLDKCEETPDRPLKQMVNLKLRVAHVYGHRVELTNPTTGEVFSALRTCLVTTDGEVHACVSEGVRKSVVRLARQHGLPPWKAGVPVVVLLKDIGGGKQWLTVVNDPDVGKKGGAK